MAVSYTVDHARKRVCVIGSGEIRLDDVLALNRALLDGGVFTYARLFDVRSGVVSITSTEVRVIAEARRGYRRQSGPVREALLATSDVNFGLARMFEAVAGDEEDGFLACRTLAEAHEWLGWSDDDAGDAPQAEAASALPAI